MANVDQRMALRLIEARKLSGCNTAQQAVDRHGLVYSTYKNYEDGQRGFARHAPRFAHLFRVNLTWLMTGTGQPRPKGDIHPVVEIYDEIPADKQPNAIDFLTFLRIPKR